MSMIRSLIDELNKSADEWNGSNMFELARMCREAADTITELCGALHVASVDYRHLEAENAELRELVHRLSHAHGKTAKTLVFDELVDVSEIDRLTAENDELRELVRDMFYAVHPCDRAQFLVNVAELGIEVDE